MTASLKHTMPVEPGDARVQRIGIVISMFPELHESFILRELSALERRGVDFQIYSLQFPVDPITHEDAKHLSQNRTHYSGLITATTLAAFARTFVRKPLATLGAIGEIIGSCWRRPGDLVKSLAIMPITMHFGEHARAQGIGHLHGHWANVPTTACWLLHKIHGFSWSAAIHGEDIFSTNPLLTRKLDTAEFTVVCSGLFCKHLQQQIGLANPERVSRNYHGLDPLVLATTPSSRPARKPDDPFKILSIGRLVPTKGLDMLLKACARLRTEHQVDVKVELIGGGPDEQTLRSLASELGIESAVDFVGSRSFTEVLEAFDRADIFCLTPRLIPGQPPDGIPNVIAEAMALKLPIVSARVSAIPELVEDGVNGLLVEVDDDQALTQALASLAHDPERARVLAEAGYSKVRTLFDQDRNIDELLAVFQQYVGRIHPNDIIEKKTASTSH